MNKTVISANPGTGQDKKRRRWILAAILFVFVAAALAPWIVAKTSLRDRVLNLLVDDPQLEVSSEDASLGWFSAMTVEDLVIKSTDSSATIRVDQLQAEKSWFRLWLDLPELGPFVVSRPQIDLVLGSPQVEAGTPENETAGEPVLGLPNLTARITNASLSIREKPGSKPVVNLRNLDIRIQIENDDAGPTLLVDPVRILDQIELTEEFCNEGLQLVLPTIADEVSVEGKISFELTRLKIPLAELNSAQPQHPVELEGIIELQQVSASIKNPITRRLVMMTVELLGLEKLPERIQIAENSQLKFRLSEGRLYHEGLGIILPGMGPDFSIQTSGSVGVDEKLDLDVVIKLPAKLLGETSLAKTLAATPLGLRVTGDLAQPRLGLPADQEWVKSLADRLTSEQLTADEAQLAAKVLKMIGDLLEETDGKPAGIPEEILDRINERK